MSTFAIELLPADYGDCLWIEYGDPAHPSRLLIDCGTASTYPRLRERVERLRPRERDFDLFVLTHIDADHIGGALPFFADGELGVHFEDVWFNGWKHLPAEHLGAKQAEIFSTLVRDRKLAWNACCDNGPLMVAGGRLPEFRLRGGMKLTLLSPTPRKLARLRRVWEKELVRHGLKPGSKRDFRQFLGGARSLSTDVDKLAESEFRSDAGVPNGTSLAFLAEYGGKSALLVGDAHSPVVRSSVAKLARARGEERLAVDAFKLSHHGSRRNLHNDLLHLLRCERFLVSTNGARFHHPDREAMARVIKHGGARPKLYFNYRSEENGVWSRADLQERYGFDALYPAEGEAGIRVEL